MNIDINKGIDVFRGETIEVAGFAHEKTQDFHENYVSKVVPNFGKYGDAAKFTAELMPGVAEYNAIREGDWKEFAIAAGIDTGAIVAGAFTAGAGFAAVKGGSVAARAGVKVATKEIAEAGTKKVVKETAETGVEKASKEVAGDGLEKTTKELAETGGEKAEKKTLEVGEKIDKTKFSEYVDEVEKITNREIPQNQKELLEKAIKENDYRKLSSEETRLAREEFDGCKKTIINEWEKRTGNEWPRYTEDVVNDAGIVSRKEGARYDAHHIIELSTSGPNEWWNIHPARFPDEHQKGIHAAERLAKQLFE